jgi:Flp pilus assembly pilin Flp
VLKLSAYVLNLLTRLEREEGQTMAEYGVILAVITGGVLLVLGLLSGGIQNAITQVTNVLP